MAVCALLLEKGQDVVLLQGHAAALYVQAILVCPYVNCSQMSGEQHAGPPIGPKWVHKPIRSRTYFSSEGVRNFLFAIM